MSSTQIVVTASTPMAEDNEHMQNFETTNREEEVAGAVESAQGKSASGVVAVEAKDEPAQVTTTSEKVVANKEVASELEDEFTKLESLKESYA